MLPGWVGSRPKGWCGSQFPSTAISGTDSGSRSGYAYDSCRPGGVLHTWPGSLEILKFVQDLICNFMHAFQTFGDTAIRS